MAIIRAATLAALFFLAGVNFAVAQDVTLTSRDGNVEISGNLLGFDGEFYRVDTVYGELTVDGSGVLCDGPGCPDLEDFIARVTLSGAPGVGRVLMPALIEAFAVRIGHRVERRELTDHETVHAIIDQETGRVLGEFTIRLNNSDKGLADLLADMADIALSLREVRPEEVDRAAEAGMGDFTARGTVRVISLDALVPVVAPSNPVQSLSMSELAGVLTGEIVNWQALGGPDAPIAVHVHAAGTGLGQATEDRILKPADAVLAETVTHHPAGPGLAQAVVADPFALGCDQPGRGGRCARGGDQGRMRFCLAGNAADGQDRGLSADRTDVPVPAGAAVSQAGAGISVISERTRSAVGYSPGRIRRSGTRRDTAGRAG